MAEPPPEKMSKAPPGTSANAGGRGRHHMEPLTRGYEDSSGKLPPDAPDYDLRREVLLWFRDRHSAVHLSTFIRAMGARGGLGLPR